MTQRHDLARQFDGAAEHFWRLVEPLREWYDYSLTPDMRIPNPDGEPIRIDGAALSGFVEPLLKRNGAAPGTELRIAGAALEDWATPDTAGALPPIAREAFAVGHIAITGTNDPVKGPGYWGVLARERKKGSPAIGISVVVPKSGEPPRVDSATIIFGRLTDGGGIRGLYVPFTPNRVNHGSSLSDLPEWSNPTGATKLMTGYNSVLYSIARQVQARGRAPQGV